MNPFTFLGTFAFAAYIYLGLYVLSLDLKAKVNRLFALFCLCFAVWTFASLMKSWAATHEEAWFWMRVSSLGWIFFVPLVVHFYLRFTRREAWLGRRWTLPILYLPPVLFFIRSMMGILVIKEVVPGRWGWADVSATDSPWFWIFIFYVLGSLVFSMVLTWTWGIHSREELIRKQSRLIFASVIPPTIGVIFIRAVLPLFGNNEVPSILSSTLVLLWAIPYSYAIFKYRLLDLTPALAAEKIVSTMPDALLLVDSREMILVANPSLHRLLGYEAGGLKGRSFESLAGPGARAREFMESDAVKKRELKFKSRTGESIPVSFYSARLKDGQGNVLGFAGIARDLREVQDLQARLFQADKIAAVGQLAGGIAHELNNPLGVILGFAQALGRNAKLGQENSLALQSIEREALRCKKLVEDLQVFTRESAGTPGETEVEPMLAEALMLVEPKARARNVSILRDLNAGGARLLGDKSRLQQVVLNLCENALEALQKGGNLTLAASLEGKNVVIEVRDDGKGMSQEVKKHLFEPFFSTKPVGQGLGLSLSLCYEIVRSHGGTLEAQSRPDRGSSFIIKIPALRTSS